MTETLNLPETLTLKEFKLWLEGFEHAFPDDGGPTGEQWDQIKDRLALVRMTDDRRARVHVISTLPPAPRPGVEIVPVARFVVDEDPKRNPVERVVCDEPLMYEIRYEW